MYHTTTLSSEGSFNYYLILHVKRLRLRDRKSVAPGGGGGGIQTQACLTPGSCSSLPRGILSSCLSSAPFAVSRILSLKHLWDWNLASMGPWRCRSDWGPQWFLWETFSKTCAHQVACLLLQGLKAQPRPTESIPGGSSARGVWSVGLAHAPAGSPSWFPQLALRPSGDPIKSWGIGITVQGLACRNSTNICCVNEGVGRLPCSSRTSRS